MGFLAVPDMVPAAIVTGRLALFEFFLASGSTAPVRTEHGGGTVAQTVETLAAQVQVHQLSQPQEPLEPFSSLWQLAIRRPLWLILLCCLAHSGTYTFPRLGSSVSPPVRHLQDPWLASFSVFQYIGHLRGYPGGSPSLVFKGPPSLRSFSCPVLTCGGTERLQRWLHPCV